MENKELWGIGRTFLLALLGLLMGFALIVMGKIPAESFVELLVTCAGIYTVKSVGHAFATKNKKENLP